MKHFFRIAIRRKPTSLLIVAVVVLATLFVANTARADVAPPDQPPGADLGPAGATQVQMVSESVLIEVGEVKALPIPVTEDEGIQAHVGAVFSMQNQGSRDESMQVRFPLVEPSGAGDNFFHYPEVANFSVSVDGEPLNWEVVETPNPHRESDPPLRWAAFQVFFASGREVTIRVEYDVQSSGYLPEGQFRYVLETGAGWYGPIQQGEIVLRLAYPASAENVLSGEYQTSPGGVFEGDEVRWHFDNLEPTSQDNWFATILAPDFWDEILQARQAVQGDPQDAAAWASLADHYRRAAVSRPFYILRSGAEGFLVPGEEAYARAVELRPGDAALHAQYASLMYSHYMNTDQVAEPPPSLEAIVEQINLTLGLEPDNQLVQDLYDEMTYMVEGVMPPLQPAQVITATSTLEPTSIPPATSTSAPTPAYPSLEDEPLPAGRLWVMGAILVLCMGVFGVAIVVIGAVVRANRPQ
jgi:hypothetical protein